LARGKPFTADDIVFNWEYAAIRHPRHHISSYKDIARIDKLDSHTVKLTFKNPTAVWRMLLRYRGMIIPKAHVRAFKGAKSREAPAKLQAVGTGPYKDVDFKPATSSARAQLDLSHAEPAHFDTSR